MKVHSSIHQPSVRSNRPPRQRTRLCLEPLEDRTLLDSYTAGTVPELLAAIEAANQTPEADTIALVAGTTFTLTEVNNTTNGATGLPTIAAGEDLTIFGNGGIIERSTATETTTFRLFDVAAGASLRLENLSLRHGWARGHGIWAQGGAVLNQGALYLEGVIVRNNNASTGMSAHSSGGGIYSSGSLTVEGGVIQNNQAFGGGGRDGHSGHGGPPVSPTPGGSAFGGGVYVAGGTANLREVSLIDNATQGGRGGNGYGPNGGRSGGPAFGGALYVASGSVDLSAVSLTSNSARGGAGGKAASGGRGGSGGNGLGGGMYAAGGDVTLRDSRVSDNRARGGAGGSGRSRGSRGQGIGGGLYIEPDALVCLDIFTESNVKRNKASTSGRNIAGPYTVCS